MDWNVFSRQDITCYFRTYKFSNSRSTTKIFVISLSMLESTFLIHQSMEFSINKQNDLSGLVNSTPLQKYDVGPDLREKIFSAAALFCSPCRLFVST